MATRTPSLRAFVPQAYVRRLRKLEDPAIDRALNAVDCLPQLLRLTSLAWAPLTSHRQVIESASDALGPDRFRKIYDAMVLDVVKDRPSAD